MSRQNTQRKPETVSVSLFNILSSNHKKSSPKKKISNNTDLDIKGRRTMRDRQTTHTQKQASKERSVYRKNLMLMKEWGKNSTRQKCKRDISKRTRDAKSKHEERIKNAKAVQSPARQSLNSSWLNTRSQRNLLNRSNTQNSYHNMSSAKEATNPTLPTTPKFYRSKDDPLLAPSTCKRKNRYQEKNQDLSVDVSDHLVVCKVSFTR
jgi:hypothetical protein